jgi:hypothetical protein
MFRKSMDYAEVGDMLVFLLKVLKKIKLGEDLF